MLSYVRVVLYNSSIILYIPKFIQTWFVVGKEQVNVTSLASQWQCIWRIWIIIVHMQLTETNDNTNKTKQIQAYTYIMCILLK